ncbi:MAG: triose-phosphate isomerase [Candidatus Moranbacteria bacterium]|nr:triose-phosphate isomerase [Candidatus Moranbacteria bacterium]
MKRYLVGNLKMNPVSFEQAEGYLKAFGKEMSGKDLKGTETIVAPPSVYLERFGRSLPVGVSLAAQDVFWEEEGSYTGQVSPCMLRDLRVGFVLVGHSERRLYAHETDAEVGWKVRASLKEDLRPILCVGETAEDREQGGVVAAVSGQVTEAFRDVSSAEAEKVIIAYEPRWAIGTDRTPETDEILEARAVIRQAISVLYGPETADRIPILYGGSVKVPLLEKVCFAPSMDGVLVGRESLQPHELAMMSEIIDAYRPDAQK